MERVLVCGDRNWTDEAKIRAELRAAYHLWPDMILCHGAARGADTIAGTIAESLGVPVTPFPADWKRFGRRAGPIRNRQMLREFRPTRALAFHDHIEQSKGTKDMVGAARAAGIPTFVYSHRYTSITTRETL